MRKVLIIATAVLAAAVAFSSCKRENKKEIGLQLYSIRAEMSSNLQLALQGVADAGYTFIEAAGYNPEQGTFYDLSPADFTRFCNVKGLKFLSSHTNGPDPNTSTMEECLSWWTGTISVHKSAGVIYIVQPALKSTAYESLAGLKAYCDLFNKVGEKCNTEKMKFGYHNHDREFTTWFDPATGLPCEPTLEGAIRMYDYMLENTDPEKVFFQIDLYWIQVGGASALDYFDRYPSRFELWHVKDDLEVGASGKIDFEAIYKEAAKSGMKYQIVEQEAFSENMTPFESIKVSRDFLQNAEYVK